MLTGREALLSIDQTVNEVRRQLQQAEGLIDTTSKEIIDLRQGQAERFKALARIRLDHMVSGDLVAGLETADHRVMELLGERVQSLQELQAQMDSSRQKLETLEREREPAAARVAQAAEDLDRAEATTQQRLREDPAYQSQLEKAQYAGRTAEYAEEKTRQADQDRAEKGAPYDSDPLFMYLWKRRFGTSEYRANFLTKYLDKWVARLCRYQDARPNYHMLREIPVRLKEHADYVRSEADREFDALKLLETHAAEKDGLPPLRIALENAEQQLEQADKTIGEQEQRIHELMQQRGSFATGEDDYFRKSLDTLVESFERENVVALYRYARATPTTEDDLLVREIADLGNDVEQMQGALVEHKRMQERHLDRLKELEGIRQKFKRERYDDVHSGFNNKAALVTILGQFLQGVASSGDLWRTIERGRRYRRIESDPTFGSGGLGRPGGGSWRLPFPSTRGGLPPGGFGGGGGGFRTGGGF